MRISPTATSQTLAQLLSPEQKRQLTEKKHDKVASIGLLAVSGNVRVETAGFVATISDGRPLNTIPFVIDETQIADVSLITDGGTADVRLIVS